MKINANVTEISILDSGEGFENNYLSLTDLAKYKNSEDPRIVISNWMSSYSTIDFLYVAYSAVYTEVKKPPFSQHRPTGTHFHSPPHPHH